VAAAHGFWVVPGGDSWGIPAAVFT
jgi:hypothetical protein